MEVDTSEKQDNFFFLFFLTVIISTKDNDRKDLYTTTNSQAK
jgi:hypothetical protein